MEFERHNHRDQRRRRLLAEEVISQQAPLAEPPAPCGPGSEPCGYPSATMQEQPRITDFIPRRKLTLCLLVAANVLIIAGLGALYLWGTGWAGLTTDGQIAAFDLDREGSLAAWYSSLLLLLAATTALVVYSVRRHRLDDYHGGYRVWLWAALCGLVLATDESASLHEGFKELMTHLTGRRLYGDGSLWWIGAYAAVLGVVGLRLFLDVRESRPARVALVLTAACWAAAVVLQLETVVPLPVIQQVLLEEGAEMLGNLMLLLGTTLYARHIILQAEGVLPAKASKKRRAARNAAGGSKADRAEPATRVPKITAATLSAPAGDLENQRRVDGPETDLGRPLSRAERRRLKKQQRAARSA